MDIPLLVASIPKPGILAILIHGSSVDGTKHQFSDIDVCLVAPGIDSGSKRSILHRLSGITGIDAHFFEDLPVMIKGDIIKRHEIAYVQDESTLFDYFLWWHRIEESFIPIHTQARTSPTERMMRWKSRKKSRKNTSCL